MPGGQRTLTIKFVGDAKSTQRSIKDIVSGLDDTESAGKRVATAMKMLADDAKADLSNARAAADQLASALGSDMVAQIEAGGRSVDGYIEDLRRMGLTFDEISADVDQLASSIRSVEDAKSSIDSVRKPLDDVDEGLQHVRDSGDQSRSVLANMVGNSAQDLGALGGVAGTAGMALGQMAEYATEGNINMSGLAKVAGPMAGVTAAVIGVTWAVGKLKENSEKAKRAAEGMLEVQKQLKEGRYEEAATKLQEEWGGTITELERMGFTTEQTIGHLTGQRDITEQLNAKIDAHRATLNDDLVAQEKYDQQMDKLRENLGLATTAFAEQGTELENTTVQTNAVEAALLALVGTTEDTAAGFATVDRSAEDYRDEVARAEQATRDLDEAYRQLTGKLDQKGAWLGLQESMRQYQWDMASGKLSTDEKREALIDLQGEMVSYLSQLEGVPAEKQTEILALIEKGDLDEAERQLTHLSRDRTVTVNTNVIAPGGKYVPGGSNVVGATGGIVTRPTQALIGEAGPEAVIPLDSVPGNMPLSSVGGFGNTTIEQHFHVSPAADLAAIGRVTAEALLAYHRQAGPVFQTVR